MEIQNLTDIQTEQILLAGAITNRERLVSLISELKIDDFYNQDNRILMENIIKLYEQGGDLDLNKLQISCSQKYPYKKWDIILVDILKTPVGMDYHYCINRIKEFSQYRQLLELKNYIQDETKNYNSIENISVGLEEKINDIIKSRSMDNVLKVSEISSRDLLITGNYHVTGLKGLDDIIMGFFEGELIILAARPAMGKSALALQIAKNFCKYGNVLFISLEMKIKEICWRLFAAESQIDMNKIKAGILNSDEKEIIEKTTDVIKKRFGTLYFMDEDYSLNVIQNKCKRFLEKGNTSLIVIDYLQLLDIPGNENRNLQLARATRSFKELAMKYNISILLLSQLNRAIEVRNTSVPILADLRDSGAIEQDANKVFFLYQEKDDDKSDKYKLSIAKDRNGRLGNCTLYFRKNKMFFECY